MTGTTITNEDRELIYGLFDIREKLKSEFIIVSERGKRLKKEIKDINDSRIGEKLERSSHSI